MRTVEARTIGVALGGAAAGSVLALALGYGPVEMLFLGALLVVAGLVLDGQLRAQALVRALRREVAELAGIRPGDAARAAIAAERERLSLDIQASLALSLRAIGELTAQARAAADPREALRGVQRESQRAAADLRRQLGLLRADDRSNAVPESVIPTAERHPWRRALAAAGVALAVLESVGYPLLEGTPPGLLPVLLAAVAALAGGVATWVWDAVWVGGLLVGFAFAAGWVLGMPVSGGFWFLAVVGSTLWSLVARVRDWRDREAVAAVVLVVSVAGSTWRTQPDNAALTAAVLLVIVAGSMTRRVLHTNEQRAEAQAQALRRELARAREAAAEAERRVLARDLHDVVTYAIGVVAVHAGSALVSWPAHPEDVTRSLAIIEDCVAQALADLPPEGGAPPRWPGQAEELLGRFHDAGVPLRADLADEVPETLVPIVYRVLQELLTNVVRHAPEAAARVRVAREEGWLRIDVEDDGPGSSMHRAPGFGLRGLSERVALAGGYAAWETLPGNGFHVTVTLPLPVVDAVRTAESP